MSTSPDCFRRFCPFQIAALALGAAIVCLVGLGAEERPAAVRSHSIPLDGFGNNLVVSGGARPNQESRPNGHFELAWPVQRARGATATSGVIAVVGATIDVQQVTANRLIKSPADFVTVSPQGDGVEFSTHSHHGRLRLPLIVAKDAKVVVRMVLSTDNGEVAMQYFLSPQGMSLQPMPPREKQKKR